MSRRNTLLPHLNLSAWLTIHQRQAAGVRREIRHPLIRKKKIIQIVFTSRFGRFRSGTTAQSNAGSPKSCGSKSSKLPSLSVASRVRLRLRLSSGTITTCMPAASPAFTPLGASSNTKHWAKRRGKTKRCYQASLLTGRPDFTLVRKCVSLGRTLRGGKRDCRRALSPQNFRFDEIPILRRSTAHVCCVQLILDLTAPKDARCTFLHH